MKATLLFATLSMLLASPTAFAKTELEILRSRCSEQERQIRMLEDENGKLRGDQRAAATSAPARETVAAAPAKPAATPTAAATISQPNTYTVKAGDSFGKIARKVNTSPLKLAKLNGLKPTAIIRPGQKLKVPGSQTAVAKTAPAESAPATAVADLSGKTHKVQPGDTYSKISKKHGVSVDSLVAANPSIKPSALRPGQLVNLGGRAAAAPAMASSMPVVNSKAPAAPARVPTHSSVAKAPAIPHNMPVSTAAPAPRPAAVPTPASLTTTAAPAHATAAAAPAPAPSPAETAAPSPTPERKIRPVTIDGEMTYGDFAAKHGTDADRLNALNGLDLTNATVLAKGSELYVPAQP